MPRTSGTTARTTALILSLLVPMSLQADDTGETSPADSVTESGSAVTPETQAEQSDNNESSQSTADEAEYLLRYRIAADEVLRYRSEKVGELCYVVGQNSKTDVEHVTQVRRFDVQEVDEQGNADLVMQFESVEMSLQVNDEKPMVYRSSMKPGEIPGYFAGLHARLRGEAPRFRISPTGTPLNDNMEIILPEKKQTDAPETRLMPPLPEKPVKVGDSWKYYNRVNVRVSEDFKRDLQLLTTCRLDSVEGNIARIRFTTSPAVRLRSVTVRAQLVSALPRGYCLLDLQSGRILKRVSRNNNSIHGIAGPQSLVTYSGEVVEELLSEDAKVSQR